MDFGFGRSCAVHASGLVTCRGDGRSVHTLSGITDAVGVVIHDHEVCAWTRSGAVRCKPYADDTPAVAVPFPDAVIQMVASGERCALLRTGDVYCGAPARYSSLTPAHDAVELAVGSRVHCVRHRDGAVSCARRDEQAPEVVLKLPDSIQARQLTLVDHDLCVLQFDESTRCWKLSREGPFIATDQQLPPLPPFTSLVTGDRFRCGLSRAGGVNCWGNNYSGQLGAISDLGRPVETVHGIDDAESLFAGSASACARRRDGSTWCWGDNQGGQLDDGRPVSVRLPGQAWHLPGLRALAVARDRTCAVLADGEITCWGTRAAWTRPRPANAPGPADALALDDYYDCALLRSGQVACRTLHRSRHEQIPDPSRGWWMLPDRGPIAAFLTLFNTVVSLHRDGSLKLLGSAPRARGRSPRIPRRHPALRQHRRLLHPAGRRPRPLLR
ncbi:RCC1 domain-containing protein [Nannocystis pusilla]|uniref:RCC1 domain-containing protein n=1 Tax=Nannocystis pusilla TaxID=889268 RepID=UPI003DA27DD3